MAKLTTVFWRDIPAQVMAKQGRQTVKRELTPRFAEAIDRAAMRSGMAGTDAYLSEWRKQIVACADDPEVVVNAEVERLETLHTDELLTQIIKADGHLVKH
jgi:hypothetical protein